jgi:predicted nucleic acid binding AN1-type Zn finger protein
MSVIKPRCVGCRTTKRLYMRCAFCEKPSCTTCVQPEVHACAELEKAKEMKRVENTLQLMNNKVVVHKVVKI